MSAPDPRASLSHLRHDLRTPINQILGYSELIREEAADAGHSIYDADLQKIRQAAKTILNLINENLTDDRLRLIGEVVDRGAQTATPFPFALGRPSAGAASQPSDQAPAPDAEALAQVVHSVADVSAQLARSTTETEAARPAAVPGRILVVDDNEGNRELLARQLSRQGHVVASAPDGLAALERLRAEPFDLVLLDMMMPVLDGYSTLVALKADPALSHLPVIMISALDEIASVVRCIERGAEDFLPKPFNSTLLRARIGAGLEKKRFRDQERAYLADIQAERAKSDRLLLNILPAPISDRLKRGEEPIVDFIAEATVLFADLVGFTRIAAGLPPAGLVARLNELFSAFDHAATRLGLEKIKTIGDAYMVAGGVPLPLPDHPSRCAELALAMLESLASFNARHALDWQIRIGLHTGPLVAGIIGAQKFAYDVWGDTVNIASRLESHGHPGEIQVSQSTCDLLAPAFELEPRGEIDLKNRGAVSAYRLLRRRPA